MSRSLDLSGDGLRAAARHIDWGPCLGIPLRGGARRDTVVIAAARAPAPPPFDAVVVPLVDRVRRPGAVALDMAARQQLARQLDVYEDRDRIARDLHDLVIQRVFAAGPGAAVGAAPGRATPRRAAGSRASSTQLDDTVRDIRTTIFDLHTTDARPRARQPATARCSTSSPRPPATCLAPTVRMSGAVDSLVTGELAADVEAVVREGVSNAVRHSGGRHVTVTLDVADDVVVEVVDDGRGIDLRAARSGLRNLERAGPPHGGTATPSERLPDGGTRLRWWAPLR